MYRDRRARKDVGGKVVSQYNLEYCDNKEKGWRVASANDTAARACDTAEVSATTRRDTTLGGRHDKAMCARLGVLLASGLCTWCTQPVLSWFDSVLFLSQFLDIVREPGS